MRYARILRKYHSAQESCSFVHVLCTFVLSCYKAISGQKKFGRGERFCLSSQRRPTSDWITSFVDDEIAETIPSLFERRRDKKKNIVRKQTRVKRETKGVGLEELAGRATCKRNLSKWSRQAKHGWNAKFKGISLCFLIEASAARSLSRVRWWPWVNFRI